MGSSRSEAELFYQRYTPVPYRVCRPPRHLLAPSNPTTHALLTSAARPFSAGDTSSALRSRPDGYLLSVGLPSSNFFLFTTGPAVPEAGGAAFLYLFR